MLRTRSVSSAASEATPRRGLANAITRRSSARSRAATPSQLAESAKAPWTRTIVGVMSVISLKGSSGRGSRGRREGPLKERGQQLDDLFGPVLDEEVAAADA